MTARSHGTRAAQAGLAIRALAKTVRDTAECVVDGDNAAAWKPVRPADVERALIAL
jgi:SpoVK/Ycf46/Vps4 family AAA+-type ATPase